MISYPSMSFGNAIDSNLKTSNYLVSAFAEDGEDGGDNEDKISDKTNSDTKDHEDENEDKDNTETSHIINGTKSYAKDHEDEDNTKNNNEDNEDETEIEVEVKSDKAIVKIHLSGDQYRFVVNDTSESAIITAIMDKTGLTEDQIRADWDFHTEDYSEESSGKNDIARENIAKHENNAKKTADDNILQLQQKIEQLEQRLQDLLNRFESGKYFGPVTNADSAPDSYSVSFTGTATSLDDASIVSDVDGNIYLESITTGSDSFKLRVTGGDILIGDTFYDFVFGKARLTSSDGTTSVIILGQIMDDQGNVSTVRLTLNIATPITSDLSAPVPFTIDSSRSKVAKQWALDATGDFGLV